MRSGFGQKGFTIVELLIVVVVIAILAAITVVAYNSVQSNARMSRVKSDLSNIAKQMAMYEVKNGEYPDTVAEIKAASIKLSSTAVSVGIYCGNTTGYAVVAIENDDRSGRQFMVGTNTSITEIVPTGGLSSVDLCSNTPYPVMLWSHLW